MSKSKPAPLLRRKEVLAQLGFSEHASRASWSHDLGDSLVFDAWEHQWERSADGCAPTDGLLIRDRAKQTGKNGTKIPGKGLETTLSGRRRSGMGRQIEGPAASHGLCARPAPQFRRHLVCSIGRKLVRDAVPVHGGIDVAVQALRKVFKLRQREVCDISDAPRVQVVRHGALPAVG